MPALRDLLPANDSRLTVSDSKFMNPSPSVLAFVAQEPFQVECTRLPHLLLPALIFKLVFILQLPLSSFLRSEDILEVFGPADILTRKRNADC
jgi:hypothetical protein